VVFDDPHPHLTSPIKGEEFIVRSKMKLSRLTWFSFLLLSFFSLFVWLKLSYPQLTFVKLTVDRAEALQRAHNYLLGQGYNPDNFQTAIVFGFEGQANRYLQKNIGYEKFLEFIKKNDFDLFFWIVRFYKENTKEEYRLTVNPATGQITSFKHIIDENEARPSIDREEAKTKVKGFLKENFNFDESRYSIRGDLQTILDHRSDFSFSWFKNSVSIPWDKDEEKGTAKLIMGATISGEEILSFSKNTFSVPDQFNRYLDRSQNIGRNLSTVIWILYLALFAVSVFLIVVRRNHLSMHTTKRFYIGIMLISFGLSLLAILNQSQIILFDFPTTVPFKSYLWQYLMSTFVNSFFASLGILMPSLAGELLHYEVRKEKKTGSFLHYIHSTFFSRGVAQSILLGYFVCMGMLGIQSVLVNIGQTFWGVWIEQSLTAQLSTNYWPFLAAFSLGWKASFFEEIMYRLFAINLCKKIFKNIFLAAIIPSLIWGFAHSGYPVFPMWFRGIEVSCLGFFLSFVYLKYGLIPVIVAHYLFDVFWASSGYLFGQTQSFNFYSSLGVLFLPLSIAGVAFLFNKKENEQPMRWHLSKHQEFNLQVLKSFLKSQENRFKAKSKEEIKKEIASHGWDIAVVEVALEGFSNPSPQSSPQWGEDSGTNW